MASEAVLHCSHSTNLAVAKTGQGYSLEQLQKATFYSFAFSFLSLKNLQHKVKPEPTSQILCVCLFQLALPLLMKLLCFCQ